MANFLKYSNIDGNNIKLFNSGEYLIKEGDIDDKIYILLEGSILIKKGDTEVSILDQKGSVIGELSIICGIPHTASCTAINNVKALSIRVSQKFLEKNPTLLYSIAKDLASKLNNTTLSLAEAVKHRVIPENESINTEINDITSQLGDALHEIRHLVELTDYYAQLGMRLLFAESLGKPEEMRSVMGLQSSDFGVCAFMGSKPGSIPSLQEIASLLPETITEINKEYGQIFQLISGGGNWDGTRPGLKTGLMGHWAYGATRNDNKAYFVTMLNLLRLEGIPHAKGATFCLNQEGDQNRLGERTDGLVCMGDVFIVFPGGLGTLAELTTIFTSADVNKHFGVKKIIIYDPAYKDNKTNDLTRYWEKEIDSIIKMNRVGFISDNLAKQINDHSIIYQPPIDISPKEVVLDIISLIIDMRIRSSDFCEKDKYRALPSELLQNFHIALNPNSIIRHLFDFRN